MGSVEIAHSPQPRLAFRVGVTGHRDLPSDREGEIQERVRTALRTVTDAVVRIAKDPLSGYAPVAPLLRIISPIAEGADRLVAIEAIGSEYELQCPLPFLREEYAQDFKSIESRQAFEALLSKATAVFELDGSRANANVAYQSVGRVMLAQSDLLIAVWDGQFANGQGGTAQMVAEAESQEIPVIWIQPDRPGEIRMRLGTGGTNDCVIEPGEWAVRVSEVLDRLLRRPRAEHSTHNGRNAATLDEAIAACLSAKRPDRTVLGSIWRSFEMVVSFPMPRRTHPGVLAAVQSPFDAYYERANATAIYFAELYRGSFVANYVLGTLAVLLALLVVVVPDFHTVSAWTELCTIGIIVTLILMANKCRWHQKSIDCRFHAEQLRHMRYLWPLARVTPSTRPPTHHSFGDPRGTCVNWRFRAVLRLVGMASARLTPEYTSSCWGLLCNHWIGGSTGQVAYHTRTAARLARIDHRLHIAARVMFLLTAAACIGHLLVSHHHVQTWLTLLTAVLPAGAAAAHAISSQGEFRRLAERSTSMASGLAQTERSLRHLGESGQSFTTTDLYGVVAPAAVAMIDEVTDWRILYRKPPIEPA